MGWILAGAIALLATLLLVPAFRDAFGLGEMDPLDWVVASAAGVAGVAWFEVAKAVRRAR